MARLRAPDGCPWDREQDHQSLTPYLVEETYEVVEAIESGSPQDLCEELGDLLLQVVFHAQLAAEAGQFDLQDVIEGISDKMERRHPHVFGDERADDAQAVRARWEALKRAEGKSTFGGVPRALPALLRATRVGEKAARLGFDWKQAGPVLAKVREELDELEAELVRDDGDGADVRACEELGDVLFSVCNLARHLGLEAEGSLRAATRRFESRFELVRVLAAETGLALDGATEAELDDLWERAKGALAAASDR
jgi:MazG family protein